MMLVGDLCGSSGGGGGSVADGDADGDVEGDAASAWARGGETDREVIRTACIASDDDSLISMDFTVSPHRTAWASRCARHEEQTKCLSVQYDAW